VIIKIDEYEKAVRLKYFEGLDTMLSEYWI